MKAMSVPMGTSQQLVVPTTATVCASVPEYFGDERTERMERIARKLRARNAVLVAHYYTQEVLQELAENTGGLVSDSLEMARFGHASDATTLVVAGVKFMGETAKILSPEKTVLMPTLEATCSLDLSCPADRFSEFCKQHPDRVVVVYANTSAAVKAQADWVVTSSIAVRVIAKLMDEGKKILWAPDRYLGRYIREVTGADMLLWQGSCVVHEEFKHQGLQEMKKTPSRRGNSGTPRIPRGDHSSGRCCWLNHGTDQCRQNAAKQTVYCRHGQPDFLQNEATGTRPRVSRSPHGRRRSDLQELRALPMDGDERPGQP